MNQETPHTPIVGYPALVTVWVALVFLTLLLATVSMNWGRAAAAITMLLITPSKAGLVAYYFMDLRHEGALLRNTVLVTLSELIVFVGLLFSDFWYR
jgi:caa(3)-type oxidase subunit IV